MNNSSCEFVGQGNVRVILRESVMPAFLDFYVVTELTSRGSLQYTEYGVHKLAGKGKWAIYEPMIVKELQGIIYQHSIYLPTQLLIKLVELEDK